MVSKDSFVYVGVGCGLASLTGKSSSVQSIAHSASQLTLNTKQGGQGFFYGAFLGYLQRIYGPLLAGPEICVDFSKPESSRESRIPAQLLPPGSTTVFQESIRKSPLFGMNVKLAFEAPQDVLTYVKVGAEFSGLRYSASWGGSQIGQVSRSSPGFLAAIGVIFMVSSSFFVAAEANFTAYRTIRFPSFTLASTISVSQAKSIWQTQSVVLAAGYCF